MADDVRAHLAAVASPTRRRDAATLLELLARVTGETPRMWATVVGFGEYHYRYGSGREGNAPAAGFAPRKAASTVYVPDGVAAHAELLGRLGPHTSGVGCLYLTDLAAIDMGVLEEIVTRSYATVTADGFPHHARDVT
jgi:hypothetical protein